LILKVDLRGFEPLTS